MTNQKLILFVTESDSLSRTDEFYISKFLRIHHMKDLQSNLYIVRYLYMGGKYNYNKKTSKEVCNYAKEYKAMGISVEIVYCFDTDKFNKDNLNFLKEAKDFCSKEGYRFVLFNPEIEKVFGVTIAGSKKETAIRFSASKIKKESLSLNRFNYSLSKVYEINYSSNLEVVLKDIFDKLE